MINEPRELQIEELGEVAGGVTSSSSVSVTERVGPGAGSATVTFANGVFTIDKSGDATVTTSYTHTP